MPITPFHLFPAGAIYFLCHRRLHGIAFILASVLMDIEPVLYLVLGSPMGSFPLLLGSYVPMSLHWVTHNPFAVFLVMAPFTTILARSLELARPLWLQIFSKAEWVDYSWRLTYLAAILGGFVHLGWDSTMHGDVNFGFPFTRISNPLINSQFAIWIGMLGLILIVPAYFVGKRINGGSPFQKLP